MHKLCCKVHFKKAAPITHLPTYTRAVQHAKVTFVEALPKSNQIVVLLPCKPRIGPLRNKQLIQVL